MGHTGRAMTLTQLNAFVLVARLGSVTAAANALGVSEPAVSQALDRAAAAPRRPAHHPRPGGHDADGRAAPGCCPPRRRSWCSARRRTPRSGPPRVRPSNCGSWPRRRFAEFVCGPLMEAFSRKFAGSVEVSAGRRRIRGDSPVLVGNRLADVAIGPGMIEDPALPSSREPIFKYRLVVVTGGQRQAARHARQWRWLVDPTGADRGSETGGCWPSSGSPTATSACSRARPPRGTAAADGSGVAPAVEHLVAQQLRRGELVHVGPAGRADRGVLARQHGAPRAPQQRGERTAPLPRHARRPCSSCAPRRLAYRRPGSGRRST